MFIPKKNFRNSWIKTIFILSCCVLALNIISYIVTVYIPELQTLATALIPIS